MDKNSSSGASVLRKKKKKLKLEMSRKEHLRRVGLPDPRDILGRAKL